MGFGGLSCQSWRGAGRPHPRVSGPATSRAGLGQKNFRLPRNPIIVWPMQVHQFNPQAEGGGEAGQGISVPKTDPSGVRGSETPGCSAYLFRFQDFRKSCLGTWWGHHGGVGPMCALPELPVRSTAMWLQRLRGSGRKRRSDGVCLTTQLNLKHMYWL